MKGLIYFQVKIVYDLQKYFITSVGGFNVKDHVKHMLVKLFSDEHVTECTRTGQGEDNYQTWWI